MIHFEGTETFPGPPAEVAAKLTDAGWLARCIPDAEITAAERDRAAWKVKPKLAFAAGVLDSTATVVSRTDDTVTYRIAAKGVGAGSTVEATLAFREAAGGTAVAWTGDITELTGLLKMVPKGLIQSAAQKVIADVWAAVKAKAGA